MMPGTARLPGARDLDLDGFVRRFLEESSWPLWLATVGSSIAFVLCPILTVYRPLPSFLLSESVRDRHADRMADHPLYLIRQAAVMIKTVMGMHWGAHPRIREAFSMAPYPADPDTWRTE